MSKPFELWIDALEFDDKGGWKEDTQYVHLMGGGYLLAADEPGVPVKDAVVSVEIPHKDRYRIWVRDRNWLREPAPGKFTVLVNGEGNGKVLGALPSNNWVWEIAGDYELEEGKATLSFHDLTGYFGRFASVIVTNDFDYVPPYEVERIHAERARIKGVDNDVKFGGEYDLIVVGGGPGGVPAAIAAARLGAKVLLIQDRSMLGGNASWEVGIPSFGAEVAHMYARESGIAEEIMRLRDRVPESFGDFTVAFEALAAAEENLTVLCDNHVIGVEMEDAAHIESVIALNFRNLSKSKFSAKMFIDCTGDAWVGYFAGAKYRYGRESRFEHNESIAPEVADNITMSGSIKGGNLPFIKETDSEVKFTLPEWCPKLPEDEENFGRVIKEPKMYWWLEAPNDYDDIYDGEETRDALLMVALGYFDHLKNHWEKKDTIKNHTFHFAGIINGRRESRRLMGDYILTQDDCTSGRMFDDVIAHSGWALDIHHPRGIYSGKEGPLHSGHPVKLVKVPYRCLYSKNIDNLLMAGRNVSATHIAIGTLRVQNTIATLGQAAGTAAAMCLKLGETPRGIYERHMHDLQQLLIKNDQFVPGVKNDDPGDPCLTAKVTASSVSTSEIFKKKHGTDGPLVPLDVARCTVSALSHKHDSIKELYLKLANSTPEPITVTVYARAEGDIDTAPQFGDCASAQAVVPPMSESWVRFPIDMKIKRSDIAGFLRVWLEKNEGISWRSIENLSLYHQRGVMGENGKWISEICKSYHVLPKAPTEPIANCAPENVINGYSRIVSIDDYEWVSDPEQELPQWIELEFREATDINWISIVFDTDMANPGTCRDIKLPTVPVCVKDYKVEVYADGKWVTVADVADNFMRKKNHSFERLTAEKIRVTAFSTWGSKSARITEVRASLEP